MNAFDNITISATFEWKCFFFFFFIKVFLEESAFPKYMLVFFKLFLKFCLTFDFSSKTFFLC